MGDACLILEGRIGNKQLGGGRRVSCWDLGEPTGGKRAWHSLHTRNHSVMQSGSGRGLERKWWEGEVS